jgi:hypothetical protein
VHNRKEGIWGQKAVTACAKFVFNRKKNYWMKTNQMPFETSVRKQNLFSFRQKILHESETMNAKSHRSIKHLWLPWRWRWGWGWGWGWRQIFTQVSRSIILFGHDER